MKSTDDRKLFGAPIGASAASGNIATIPQTQATAGDGTASVALGFPPETFVARAAGGEPPRGQDMNGLLNLLSAALQVLQAGYLGPFSASFAQGIGGYPAGAIVSGATPGTFWVSTADANVSTPGADGATWQSLFNGYATQAWANQQFLQLDDEEQQTVSGPVAFDGETTVPDVSVFTGKDALNAETAEGRYIQSVPATGQTRVNSFIENSDGRAVFSAGSSSTILANESDITTGGIITNGTYTKTPLNDGTGRSILRQKFYVTTVDSVSSDHFISFPFTYSEAPNVTALSSREVTQSGDSTIVCLYAANIDDFITASGVNLRTNSLLGPDSGTSPTTAEIRIMVDVEGIVA